MSRSNTTLRNSARAHLAWLLLYVAGLLGQGLHWAVERHELCEHGEVAHAGASHLDEGHAADVPAADFDSTAAQHGPVVSGTGTPDESEHHHCGIAVASPLVELALAPPAGVPAAPKPLVRFIPRGEPRTAVVALLRLAPHHSPPVA